MMKKLNMAVVGCGRYAREWMESLPQVEDVVNMVAVVDTDFSRAQAFKERFNVPKAYASVDEALLDDGIEALGLVLPHHLHHDIAVTCMRAGRHVLVDKIMSLSYADSMDMVHVADECGVTLMSGQTQRFASGHRIAHDKVHSGELGDIFNISATFRSCILEPATPWWAENRYVGDGFIVPMKGSHTADIITWVMGGKIPIRAYAQARRMKDCWEGWDEVVYTLTYENGATATEHMTYNTDRDANCQCIRAFNGTKGLLVTDFWGRRVNFNGEVTMYKDNSLEFLAGELREFASAIAQGREPIASGREVAPVNAIIEAITLSAHTDQAVDIKAMFPQLFIK